MTYPLSGNDTRPASNCRDANATLQQIALLAREWPFIREALAAVIAGKDHESISIKSAGSYGLHHATNTLVQNAHHLSVHFERAATTHRDWLNRLVSESNPLSALAILPGPVRGRVMQT